MFKLAVRTQLLKKAGASRAMSLLPRPVFKEKYDNFYGGKFVPPIGGKYFENPSPIDGVAFTKAARSGQADIDAALDAAHAAAPAWGKLPAAARSNILLKIADRIEANLEHLAIVETVDNGKAVRETINADLPLVVDHFRYFAGVIRADEGAITEIDEHTVSIILNEPLGVVGQVQTPCFAAVRPLDSGCAALAPVQHTLTATSASSISSVPSASSDHSPIPCFSTLDHPLELPPPHGRLEGRTRPSRRQLRRPQAR
jgi:hypothetical protein